MKDENVITDYPGTGYTQINADNAGTGCTQMDIDKDYSINLDENFKYKKLTHEILNASFEVHNTLGCGFLEKVYENALVYELRLRGYKVEVQKDIEVKYKNQIVGRYIGDVIVEDKVIVELKTVKDISNVHKAQLLNYLKATGYEVGLILNFAKTKLEYKRLVMIQNGINVD